MKSISHTAGFNISQSIDKVFPLFTPEGEKLWVPGWDYKNIMGTTDLYEDYVFLTANHDHASADAIWLVKKYNPEKYLIELYRIEPGNKVGVVTVKCNKINKNKTHVDITYKYIALSNQGIEFLENFTIDNYKKFIGQWQDLLNQYFETLK